MTGRRIILLLDGTWNDADLGATDTNISRLQDLISLTTGAGVCSPFQSSKNSSVTSTFSNAAENLVFYSRGVGTAGWANQILGGVLGTGLEANIRRAYRFLSFYYRHGDQIFIFGFSRGSYTARSLVGYIAAAGLLRYDECSEENERCAWDFYRAPPGEKSPGEWHRLTPFMHNRKELRIDCLAVLDTVGAMGIPLSSFVRSNRERYEFHDVELPSITRVNLHALAIDEHRWPFQATVWRPSKFKKIETVTEQVWFAGSHADIGGGYLSTDGPRASSSRADDVTLDWLLKRLNFHFSDFPAPPRLIPDPFGGYGISQVVGRRAREKFSQPWSRSNIHNSRSGIYRLYPKALRAIANEGEPHESNVGIDRHSTSLNEMIHISAIERLWTSNGPPHELFREIPARLKASIEKKSLKELWNPTKTQYRPSNLLNALEMLESFYRNPSSSRPIYLVDWDGEILNPNFSSNMKRANKAFKRVKERAMGLE